MTKRNLFWWTFGAVWGTLMLKPLISNLIKSYGRRPKEVITTNDSDESDWIEVPLTKED